MIGNQQNFWSGLMFLAFGLAGTFLSLGYKLGTAQRMGPGYFPLALSAVLSVLGLIIVVQSLLSRERGGDIGRTSFKVVGLVLGSVVVFAFLLNSLGLIAATFGVIIVSSLASDEFTWRAALVSGFCLALGAVALFVWGLKLQIPVWPPFLSA